MSAKQIRARFAPEFKTMGRYPAVTAWSIVAGYVLQMALSAWIGTWLLSGGVSVLEGLFIFGLMVFIATRIRGLNNIVHECSHASFAEKREDNVAIGKVCASLTLGSFVDYRHEHLSHHAHLGNYERDLDLQGIESLRLHDPLTPRVVLRHIVTPLIFRQLPYYLSINLTQNDGRFFQLFKLGILAAVTASTVLFPLSTALFAILPYVAIYTALNYWADCLDHAGLVPTDEDLEGSRNVLAPKALAWLFFPRNDGYHLVHHLFPNVPARHLPAVHRTLLEDAVYRSAPNAVAQGTKGAPAGVKDGLAEL